MQTNSSTKKLPQRKINNEEVPAIGIGLMGMSAFYKFDQPEDEAERQHMEVLTHAADSGETFWDTSDAYGPFTNEELIGRWFKATGRRKEIFLATKFALSINPVTHERTVRGDPEYVRQCIDNSLKRLQTDYVDLYYQHRVDKNVRIEDTVGAMAELVKAGKVRHIGLSECSTQTLHRAHKVHPIAAVQIEYSLFTLDIEREEIGLKKACDELGITIVAYSPLGRGFLTGQYKSRSDFNKDDLRLTLPRFSEENFGNNLELVNLVTEFAKQKGCTTGQVALAWLLAQSENVIPIPGTRQIKYLDENLGALNVTLSTEETQKIREMAEKAEIKGTRYATAMMAFNFGDTI